MIPTLYPPFRHWSETGSVWILSDLHFADADCKQMDFDWPSPEELLKRINKAVRKTDTFVCLGDGGKADYVEQIRAGRKVLLLGNHDARGKCKPYFDEIYAGPLFIAEQLLLSHEPVIGLPWAVNIHGHDHGNKAAYQDDCRHLNLAANVCGYEPVNLGKLIKVGILSGIPTIHRLTIDRKLEDSKNEKKDVIL